MIGEVRLSRFVQVAFAAAILLPSAVAAGESEQTVTRRARVLAGHTFVPSALVESPFMTREYDMYLGIGVASIKGPNDRYYYAVAGLSFYTQQAIADVVALRFGVNGNASTGATADTALDLGASGGFGLGGGLKAKFFHNDRFSIGAVADVNWSRQYSIVPRNLVNNQLFDKENSLHVEPGITMAVGLLSFLGIYTDVNYDFGYDFSNKAHSLEWAFGFSFNFDPVPLGLGLGYELAKDFTNDQMTHEASAGLFYMWKQEFALGLIFDTSFLDGKDFIVFSGYFGMAYYQ